MKEQDNENEEIISLSALSFYLEEATSLNLSIDDKSNNKKNSKNKNKTVFTIDKKILDKKKKTNDIVGLTGKKKNSSNFIKSLVSKDKNRFCFDGFDLDLSYITPRIIAMGLPCTSYEAIYRNNIEDIKYIIYVTKKHMEKIFFINRGLTLSQIERPLLLI